MSFLIMIYDWSDFQTWWFFSRTSFLTLFLFFVMTIFEGSEHRSEALLYCAWLSSGTLSPHLPIAPVSSCYASTLFQVLPYFLAPQDITGSPCICPALVRKQPWLQGSWAPLLKNGIRNQDLGAMCAYYWGICFYVLPVDRARKYNQPMYTHTYIFLYLSICIHMKMNILIFHFIPQDSY